ncbi:hypothetical protein HELRODRAFT_159063 [Helobdella robusta]|uniref:Uncharacterized protein n=1 Tax=Helobdella robusta TaxID=6412 RepID=T1ENJ6_HELRO|nr:hypothetical protein HELRODRAFT_159063 [Helobdella robusta]ESO12511.1 hypothetical protein HELRODRAFT_159063 [Helobdella robusta]
MSNMPFGIQILWTPRMQMHRSCGSTNIFTAKNLNVKLLKKYEDFSVKIFSWKVSTFGFVSDLKEVIKCLKLLTWPDDRLNEFMRNVTIPSFDIYCNRNNL